MPNTPPNIKKNAFDCPHCGAYAHQYWFSALADRLPSPGLPILPSAAGKDPLFQNALRAAAGTIGGPAVLTTGAALVAHSKLNDGYFAQCAHCAKVSIWMNEALVWPDRLSTPPPNEDMPEDIRNDYLESASIISRSPRGAAALLRLAIQKLCALSSKHTDINGATEELLRRGLDTQIVAALDILRVIGNSAVHPGQLDLRDDRATASKLFELMNLVVDGLVSRPKRLDALMATLPSGAKDAIEKRNARVVAQKPQDPEST